MPRGRKPKSVEVVEEVDDVKPSKTYKKGEHHWKLDNKPVDSGVISSPVMKDHWGVGGPEMNPEPVSPVVPALPVVNIKQVDYDNLNEKQLDLLNELVFVSQCPVPREEITKSDWAEAPDFSRSLDACRHFEKSLLSEDIKAKYIMAILTQYPVDQIKCRAWQMLRFANPVELCVAYLKAVGVWERDGVENKLESLA